GAHLERLRLGVLSAAAVPGGAPAGAATVSAERGVSDSPEPAELVAPADAQGPTAGAARTPVSVNGQPIPQTAIAAEATLHPDSVDPLAAAATALVLRRLIVDRARSRGLLVRDEPEPADADLDDALDALLALEAQIPEPKEDELQRFHERNPALFRIGERVHVAHILFEVRTMSHAEPLRERADAVLERCMQQADYFPQAARELSNCPSGASGGDLGWLVRGESVPEFERVIFTLAPPGLWPRPVATRFGWHLIRILERDEGRPLPYESARERVAAHVRDRSRRKAGVQYLQRLAAEARVEGVDLHLRPGWLMQ
ncbi:MAG: peptidylprolyl isomerase, partial [Steroidobacteraceae bacterium]